MAEHEATRREVTRQEDGSHLGVLICSCGWAVTVGPFTSEPLTEATMNAEWAFHTATVRPKGG